MGEELRLLPRRSLGMNEERSFNYQPLFLFLLSTLFPVNR